MFSNHGFMVVAGIMCLASAKNVSICNSASKFYMGQNVIVLGFPCNQFGLQEPGKPSEILNCYHYVRPGNGWTPNAKFQIVEKIDVNGGDEHPLYAFLKGECPAVLNTIGSPSSMYWSPIKGNDITWNFGKFLIDKTGKPRFRFPPSFSPILLRRYINRLLAEDNC